MRNHQNLSDPNPARIVDVIRILNQWIFIRIAINIAGNLGQGIARLNRVSSQFTDFTPGIGTNEARQDLLDGFAFILRPLEQSLIGIVVQINLKVLYSHPNLPLY